MKTMRLEEAMCAVKTEVDAALARFFGRKRAEAAKLGPAVVELVDQVADVTLRGGKRMRPFLAWVGYHAMQNSEFRIQNKTPKDVLRAMLGIELFQTFALIHDDIMDEDSTRRGGKTVQEHFRTQNLELNDQGKHFGESMAILAGDLALMWADELMGARDDILKLYQKMKEEVIYGQMLDVTGGAKDKADELKTAWYSVVRPLQIGSGLALKTWERYGVPVGRLFQLRDDVMDGVLTQNAFEKQARPLEKKALEALEPLETSTEIKQLLVDFVQFVQNRKS